MRPFAHRAHLFFLHTTTDRTHTSHTRVLATFSRNVSTPDAVSKHLEAMFKWQPLRLTAEVHREKFERLKNELDFIKSQWDHIKQKYESTSKTYKDVMKDIADKRKSGIELVEALLKDPDAPELGTWKCEKTNPNDKMVKPPSGLIKGEWTSCPSDIAALQAMIDVCENDVADGSEFYKNNRNLPEKAQAKRRELAEARDKLSKHRAGNSKQAKELEDRKLLWQNKVETTVKKIHLKFEKLMMGKTKDRPGYENA